MGKPKNPPVPAGGGKGSGKPPGWKSGHHKGIVPHHPVGHHHPHHAPAPKKPHKKRQWSPGCDVACCSAEAVGLLLGWDWDDVLALYWRTSSDPDAGASILATLDACQVFPCAPRGQRINGVTEEASVRLAAAATADVTLADLATSGL